MIPGWGLRFHKLSTDGSAKCNVIEADETVLFALFDIEVRERKELDRVEGLGYGYEERAIDIQGFGSCFCYVASHTHVDESLAPYSWYKELVVAGLEYHQAPYGYLEEVRSVDHNIDEDETRHNENMDIAAAARNGT